MRKVTFAKFHTGIIAPGLTMDVGTTLPSANKNLDPVMETSELGLWVKLGFKGKSAELLVPWANVVCVMLAPEAVTAPKAAVKAA